MLCMYVCIYVCMNVCMYVYVSKCMYICMYGWIDGYMYANQNPVFNCNENENQIVNQDSDIDEGIMKGDDSVCYVCMYVCTYV